MKNIGDTLRELRKNCNYSVYDIINKLEETNIHVRVNTIYKWENNICIPDIETINVLSNIYGISLTGIYEDSKFCKALNKNENEFIKILRSNIKFRKIVKLLVDIKDGE